MIIARIRHSIVQYASRRIFYGWVVLLVAGAGVFASGPGQSHTFSVFIGPISKDLGIGATEITAAYGLATLIAAFGLPFMGRLVDRNGVVMMMLIVITLLGFMCIFFGLVPALVWLGVGFCGVRFLAQGSLMLNCANVISHWFARKRGFAMGVMLLGFAVSMAIHPIASQWLIDHVGWREAWFWLGVSTWCLMIPLVILLLHNAPEPLGLKSDGVTAEEPEEPTDHRHSADFGLTLAQALGTPTFYIVASGLFTMSMLITTLHFFQVSIFEQQGLSPTVAAWMFALSAVVAVLSQPIFGRGLDRLPTHRMFGIALLILCGSLISVTLVRDLPTALLYGVIFGINNAVSMTLFGYLWPRYFGRKHLGSIQGTGQMIGVVGASIGPLPLGIAFDLFGDYNEMLYVLAVIPILVAIPTQFLREPDIPVSEETV